MTHVHRALAPALAATEKLPVESVHRRIAEACLRLARRNDESKRELLYVLLQYAVHDCIEEGRKQEVRMCYRQFQWAALNEGLDTSMLPSESTFRRRVKRARGMRDIISRGPYLIVDSDLEAAARLHARDD